MGRKIFFGVRGHHGLFVFELFYFRFMKLFVIYSWQKSHLFFTIGNRVCYLDLIDLSSMGT